MGRPPEDSISRDQSFSSAAGSRWMNRRPRSNGAYA